MVKLLRKLSIPVATFMLFAANTAGQQDIRENLGVLCLGGALIVLAGMLCVGKRWMYFIFPLAVAFLLSLLSIANNYAQFAEYFGHKPNLHELAAFMILKWQREYDVEAPYWLMVDIVYFVASYIAGWLYGSWSMLVPGTVKSAQVASAPSVTKVRKPFKIMLWVFVAVILLGMLFGRSR